MMLSDSTRGSLPHLGEEAVAGCEMLLNKVILRVMVRPVTQSPPLLRNRLVLHTENILSVNLPFVSDGSVVSLSRSL